MTWPFDDPRSQIPFGLPVPKVGPEPIVDPNVLKIRELEQRMLGLEQAMIEICKAVQVSQQLNSMNFKNIEQSFYNLVNYVMQPKALITDSSKDRN